MHQFSARIGSIRGGNSTVHMQIWRPVGNDNYQLIRTKKIDNMQVGVNEVKYRIRQRPIFKRFSLPKLLPKKLTL